MATTTKHPKNCQQPKTKWRIYELHPCVQSKRDSSTKKRSKWPSSWLSRSHARPALFWVKNWKMEMSYARDAGVAASSMGMRCS